MSDMMISYLIPAYNSESTIGRVLESIKNQSYKTNYEIIVLNDGSKDRTRSIVSGYGDVKLINQQNRGLGYGRNRLLKEAKGDLIIFLDSDIILDRDWLKEIMKNQRKGISGYTGSAKPENKENVFCRLDQALQPKTEQVFDINNQRVCPMNYLIERKVFDDVGKFNPIFKTNAEDVDWFIRAFKKGYKFLFIPSARAVHAYKPPNLLGFIRKRIAYTTAARVPFIQGDRKNMFRYSAMVAFSLIVALLVVFALLYYPIQVIVLLLLFALTFFIMSLRVVGDAELAVAYMFRIFVSGVGFIKAVLSEAMEVRTW